MKKLIICLILCIIGFNIFGQGTAYITKSSTTGYSKMIRQYANNSGKHVVCFSDGVTSGNWYLGITDVYTNMKYVHICRDCIIKDIEVLDNTAYFCGETSSGKGLLGWVDLSNWIVSIDSIYFHSYYPRRITSLDNIEVYNDAAGVARIVGYGKWVSGLGYVMFEYNVGAQYCSVDNLPYRPLDMTLTDNYIVYLGDRTHEGTLNMFIIHPLQKNVVFPPTYAPTYSYPVGTGLVDEPYNFIIRITDIGDDAVATLNYRLESGIYSMMLRQFDLSQAFVNFYIPMLSSYQARFYYIFSNLYDFQYDVSSMAYTIFQNYEVSPLNYRDVVTKIDFSSGMPTIIPSDYHNISDLVTTSISISDSAMYVVYGHDILSGANMFWKDFYSATVIGTCLSEAILPFYTATSVSPQRNDVTFIGGGFHSIVSSRIPSLYSETIGNICH